MRLLLASLLSVTALMGAACGPSQPPPGTALGASLNELHPPGPRVVPAEDEMAASARPLPEGDAGVAEAIGAGPAASAAANASGVKAEPAAAAPVVEALDDSPRIGALGPHVWIWPKPSQKGLALGKIRLGTSVKLADPEPVRGASCRKGWYRVKPRGYVCLNIYTTMDLTTPYFRALSEMSPHKGTIFPYRYAYSRGAPMYSRVPTPEEWVKAEARLRKIGKHQELGDWAKGHEELLEPEKKITATDPVPWFFEGGKRRVSGGLRSARVLVWKTIPNGSMLAYKKAFEMHGRVWLVTPDLTIVPADRVQTMRRSKFVGVKLSSEVTLPIAFNRSLKPRPLYREEGPGQFVKTGEEIAPKGWLMVAPGRRGKRADPYYELRTRAGYFVRGKDTTLTRARTKLPQAIKPGEKWIDARIVGGTLTAYVGLKPVYATLFSPGKGGPPVPGYDHSKYATTQTGYFRFEWKEAVATMSNEKGDPKVLWFSDVPNIQYIRAPLAMHVAYWHEDFSMPKSAECVNLSPLDGKWLFGFTEPQLPEDWGAVRPGGGFGRSTTIMINPI